MCTGISGALKSQVRLIYSFNKCLFSAYYAAGKFGSWRSEIKVPAYSVSGEDPLPGL